ncbi:quercetin 2-3-dioxygenase anaerobically complexed with the substrate kaempferol [Penicillium lividum]|nr:quercetin 2-3-dioxygenase anaerobically complexed with the substrate kaempferol [Penicillium lividum]
MVIRSSLLLLPQPRLRITLSTISISATPENATIPIWNSPGAAAFQVLEGMLSIQIGGFKGCELTTGNVPLKYWSESYFTKLLLLSSGEEGVD